MDSVTLVNKHITSVLPPIVRPHQLCDLIQQHYHNYSVLSLDCFDTLIWRHVATPTDVFYDLQSTALFTKYGITARLRQQAESNARERKKLKVQSTEVTLNDIYRDGLEGLSQNDIEALINEELAIENKTCFAFQPVVDLINTAKKLGLKIIIASDTYFSKSQLTNLLRAKLPPETFAAIDQVFCSSEYGRSKINGLFKEIMDELHIHSSRILHIGDNQLSDVLGAKQLSISSCRLVAHTNETAELLRMQNIASSFVDPEIRNHRSIPNLYHSVLASHSNEKLEASYQLGYATLGPIMYAFGLYIINMLSQLTLEGKRPRPIFLMRDAFLPSQVCEAILNETIGERVRISRFSAYAASFRSVKDIETYLASRIASEHYEDYCRQLLLSEDLTKTILQKIKKAGNPSKAFYDEIMQPEVVEQIISTSIAYADRLIQHLQHQQPIQPNEILVLIDLGYSGTAQIKLESILKSAFGVDVLGCYLISLSSGPVSATHHGLFDHKNYDDNFLIMLVSYIALLEQLCTVSEASVIDYDDKGIPLNTNVVMESGQNNKLLSVQAHCIQFIKDIKKYELTLDYLEFSKIRDAAAIHLSRLLFLPTKSEIDYLSEFHFDFNMGSEDVISLMNTKTGIESLCKRGWLYSAKECSDKMRTNFSAEWRAAGVELALTLMMQHRYHLEFAMNDISHRRETLAVTVFQSGVKSSLTIDAIPTYDGYYALIIPVVHSNAVIGIHYGALYHWVEISSAELVEIAKYNTAHESKSSRPADNCFSVYELQAKLGGLYECETTNAMLMFDPSHDRNPTNSLLRIIFRPIVNRVTTT